MLTAGGSGGGGGLNTGGSGGGGYGAMAYAQFRRVVKSQSGLACTSVTANWRKAKSGWGSKKLVTNSTVYR